MSAATRSSFASSSIPQRGAASTIHPLCGGERTGEVARPEMRGRLGVDRGHAEPWLLRRDGELTRRGRVLNRVGHVTEHGRGHSDHGVRVDELVAVLQRSCDRDATLVLPVGLAVVAELAVRVSDGVQAQRHLAQPAELFGDRERLLRRAQRVLQVAVGGARQPSRGEGFRGEQQHTLTRMLVAHQHQAVLDQAGEVRVPRVPARDELGHVRVDARDFSIALARAQGQGPLRT